MSEGHHCVPYDVQKGCAWGGGHVKGWIVHLYITLECLLCAHTGEGHSVVCWEVLCETQESNRVLCAHTRYTFVRYTHRREQC